MKIDLNKAIISAGVGVVDTAIEEFAADRQVFGVSATDAFRIAATAGSFLVNWLGYERDITETVFYSSLPLFVKSVKNMVKKATAGAAAAPVPTPVVVKKVEVTQAAPAGIPP